MSVDIIHLRECNGDRYRIDPRTIIFLATLRQRQQVCKKINKRKMRNENWEYSAMIRLILFLKEIYFLLCH